MRSMKKYVAEFIGTMLLVVFGCGVAVATGCTGNDGLIATALAFGLSIVALAYSIGNISGCHVNPAVALARVFQTRGSKKDYSKRLALVMMTRSTGTSSCGPWDLVLTLAILSTTSMPSVTLPKAQ